MRAGIAAALALIFVFTTVTSGFIALQPLPLMFLIDHALESRPLSPLASDFFSALSLNPTRGTILTVVVIAGLLIFVLSSALDAALAWIWTVVGRRIV
jgi:hypothetical protein